MRAAGGGPAADSSPGCELCVLGTTMVRQYGVTVALRPRELDVLAALAVHHPLPAGWGAIAETIWPETQPRSARETIQNHVARVRRRLGGESVLTAGGAYRLSPMWSLDAATFDAELGRAERAVLGGDNVVARMHLGRALALVRGEAFADLPTGAAVNAARARRRQQRLAVEEQFVIALLAGHDIAAAVAEAAVLVSDEPFRETRWMLYALALYHDGQRRESLLTLQRGRDQLRVVAGLESGPALDRLEALILTDDPALGRCSPESLLGHHTLGSTELAPPAEVLLGRSAILDDVRRALAGRFDQTTALTIDVRGASGTGKSSLARRIAAQATIDGWHVVVVSGSGHPGRVLEPLGQVVGQLLDMEPNPADVFDARLLDDVRALWADGTLKSGRGHPGRAIVQVIEQHASRYPTLLVIDDAHRVPITAGSLLTQLRTSSSTLAILTLRVPSVSSTDETTDPVDVAYALDGLGIDDAGRLFEVVSGQAAVPEDFAVIYAATAGVPALIRQVAVESRGGTEPGTVVEATLACGIIDIALARLTPDVAEVVALLGIATGPLPSDVIAAAARLDRVELDRVLGEAAITGLATVDVNGLVHLSNEVFGAAAIARLDDLALRHLHGRVGEAFLDLGFGPLAAADHVLAGRCRDPIEMIDLAVAAAAIARAATMFEEAAGMLARAAAIAEVSLAANDPRTLRLLIDQAENLRLAGDPSNVTILWDVVDRAGTVDGDTLAMAVAGLCKLGPLTESGREDARLAAEIERALEVVRDPRIRSDCAGQATLFYSLSGGVDRCRQLFDESLSAARASGDPATILQALGNVYASLVHPDDWILRAELADEMLTLAERVDDDEDIFQALHLYFSTQVIFSDPLLRTTFERQARLARSLRMSGRRWMAGYHDACLAYLAGRLDESMAISDEIFERVAISRSRALGTYFMNLVVVRLAEGRSQELVADVDRIIEDQSALPGWRCVGAWLAALRGEFGPAGDVCDAFGGGASLPRDMSWSGAVMLLGRAIARSGDEDRTRVVTDVLAPYSGLMTWIGSTTVGPFDLALAELAIVAGDHAAASGYVAGAQRSIDRIGAVVFQPDLDQVTASISSRVLAPRTW